MWSTIRRKARKFLFRDKFSIAQAAPLSRTRVCEGTGTLKVAGNYYTNHTTGGMGRPWAFFLAGTDALGSGWNKRYLYAGPYDYAGGLMLVISQKNGFAASQVAHCFVADVTAANIYGRAIGGGSNAPKLFTGTALAASNVALAIPAAGNYTSAKFALVTRPSGGFFVMARNYSAGSIEGITTWDDTNDPGTWSLRHPDYTSLIKGWILVCVCPNLASFGALPASVYMKHAAYTAGQSNVRWLGFAGHQLPAPFTTDYGIAEGHVAAPDSGEEIEASTPFNITSVTWTPGDVDDWDGCRLISAYKDANNYWCAEFGGGAGAAIFEVSGGVKTSRATSGATYLHGVKHHLAFVVQNTQTYSYLGKPFFSVYSINDATGQANGGVAAPYYAAAPAVLDAAVGGKCFVETFTGDVPPDEGVIEDFCVFPFNLEGANDVDAAMGNQILFRDDASRYTQIIESSGNGDFFHHRADATETGFLKLTTSSASTSYFAGDELVFPTGCDDTHELIGSNYTQFRTRVDGLCFAFKMKFPNAESKTNSMEFHIVGAGGTMKVTANDTDFSCYDGTNAYKILANDGGWHEFAVVIMDKGALFYADRILRFVCPRLNDSELATRLVGNSNNNETRFKDLRAFKLEAPYNVQSYTIKRVFDKFIDTDTTVLDDHVADIRQNEGQWRMHGGSEWEITSNKVTVTTPSTDPLYGGVNLATIYAGDGVKSVSSDMVLPAVSSSGGTVIGSAGDPIVGHYNFELQAGAASTLWECAAGVWSQRATGAVPSAGARRVDMCVSELDTKVACYVDGTYYFEYASYAEYGPYVGIETYGTCVDEFDSLSAFNSEVRLEEVR